MYSLLCRLVAKQSDEKSLVKYDELDEAYTEADELPAKSEKSYIPSKSYFPRSCPCLRYVGMLDGCSID